MGENRIQTVTEIVFYDRFAELLKKRSAELRAELAADARAELEEQGTAPTWRIPDVATVAASVSHQSVVVADNSTLTAWMADRYPTEVETITQIRPAWLKLFLAQAAAERADDGSYRVYDTATGERVPGVDVKPGGEFGGVSIRVSADAKAVFDALAADRLARLELEASTPTVLAEVPDVAA